MLVKKEFIEPSFLTKVHMRNLETGCSNAHNFQTRYGGNSLDLGTRLRTKKVRGQRFCVLHGIRDRSRAHTVPYPIKTVRTFFKALKQLGHETDTPSYCRD
jgi:hypothetical protein